MRQIDQAIAAHQAGNLPAAETLYREVLRRDGRNFDALHMLGVLCAQRQQFDEAERLLRSALAVDQKVPPCYYNYANVLSRLKRHDEAIKNYDKALSLAPNHAPIYSDRGNAQKELGRLDDALRSYDRAIALNPNFAEAYYNRGIALEKLKRHQDALASYNRALALQPNYAAAFTNRGAVLLSLRQLPEALANCDRAIALDPNLALAHATRGAVLLGLKRFPEALASCERAIALEAGLASAHNNRAAVLIGLERYADALASCERAIALEPGLALAHSNRGAVLLALRRSSEALASCDRAIALEPGLANAHDNRGAVLLGLKRFSEALASLDQAIAVDPGLASAQANRGAVLLNLGRFEEGFLACDRAFAIDPGLKYAEGNRLHAKQQLCDWNNLAAEIAHLLSAVRSRQLVIEPFSLLALSPVPADQLICAQLETSENWPAVSQPLWRGEIYSHERIRVAYLSSDLRDHAIGYLTIGLFEHHDKSRFEVTAISSAAEQDSDLGRRIKASFEHFVDARSQNDQEIADLIRRREIDIVVDLNGFTRNGRIGVLARRPAPIQVNYLGYSGTMGSDYYDYILADSTVIPEEQFQFYSEKVVWLPDSFFVNDAARPVAERTPSRGELRLPETGFVFCCFNQSYKFNPAVFDVWMRLLNAVDGSVLWMRENDAAASRNLRLEAEKRGVAPERLVFAPPVPLIADHLARQRQADLFLDTLPYNAHTTASDALWAGLPVITCPGSTFAGRVAASLLKAAGLSELIAASPEEYEAMALRLARDPATLASVRQKLARSRNSCPLFDTARTTRHIEMAYIDMQRRYRAGEMPASFAVGADTAS